jgi:hypothetical protein
MNKQFRKDSLNLKYMAFWLVWTLTVPIAVMFGLWIGGKLGFAIPVKQVERPLSTDDVAEYVLQKNRDLYKRLAQGA